MQKFLDSTASFDFLYYDRTRKQNAFGQDLDFRWGDVSHALTKENIRYQEKSGRNNFSPQMIEEYLDIHNLTGIIKGHQDAVNLGLARSTSEEAAKDVSIDGKVFSLENNRCPGILWVPKKDHSNIKLKTRSDFNAVITSSASEAKKLPSSVYLLFE